MPAAHLNLIFILPFVVALSSFFFFQRAKRIKTATMAVSKLNYLQFVDVIHSCSEHFYPYSGFMRLVFFLVACVTI